MQDTLKRWLCPALCINTLTILKMRKYGKLPSEMVFEIFTCRLGLFRSVGCIAYILGLNLPIDQSILIFKRHIFSPDFEERMSLAPRRGKCFRLCQPKCLPLLQSDNWILNVHD